MNKLFYYLVLSLSTLMPACQKATQQLGDFKLLPLPQQFTISTASALKPGDLQSVFIEKGAELPILGAALAQLKPVEAREEAQVIAAVDNSLDLPAEGYVLSIQDDDVVTIRAKEEAGLFYAFRSLAQLVIDASDQRVNLPNCEIKDFPKLAYRAIHLDIKHHLDKTAYYYRLIDKLANYKINGIIVELEDKLKFKRQPKVASDDAWSIEEWQKLSSYAKDRFIEISPLVQGLGHSSFVLKHDEYKHLRDKPDSDWAYNPLDPETYKVQFDLYLDAIEATPHGKYLHVGGDEVRTTGRGSGKSQMELQLHWLNKVSKFAAEHNRIPICWDDMPLKHAGVYAAMFNTQLTAAKVDEIWQENEHKLLEFLDRFPKNCIYMRWNYRAAEAIGNTRAMQWFRAQGLQVMGATAGQTRWVLMPQAESNMLNIKNFALSAIDNDLRGLLLTLWDDDSPHFELYMRGILAFAEYTWTGDKRTKEEIKEAYRQRQFSRAAADAQVAFIDELEVPVSQWKNILLNGNSRSKLVRNSDALIDMPNPDKKGGWAKKYAERLEKAESMLALCSELAAKIENMKAKATRNKYNLEVYEQVNALMAFSYGALLKVKSYDEAKTPEESAQALEALRALKSDFNQMRAKLEEVYGKTRILTKPDNYILDRDRHNHLANQSISFDWQFYAEILFLEKLADALGSSASGQAFYQGQ